MMEKMLTSKSLMLLTLIIVSRQSWATTALDDLILRVANQNLPPLLYQQKQQKWELGTYDIKVNKLSPLTIQNTDQHLQLSIPFEAVFNSKVNRKLLGVKLALDCDSSVRSEVKIKLKPVFSEKQADIKVAILVPVPPTQLNCKGNKVPITPYLKMMVQRERKQWEQNIQTEILKAFAQLGL